ncbi:hypothetical protein LV779_27315 [Streptomyces thinghirensis]|nr:hypothetical protein [Streptomyces thinghirensis]
MKYRTLGTDPAHRREVSVLALGAMLFRLADRREDLLRRPRPLAVEAGGNFIDIVRQLRLLDGRRPGRPERGTPRPLAAQPAYRRRDRHRHQARRSRPLAPRHQLHRQPRGPVGQGDPRGRGPQPGAGSASTSWTCCTRTSTTTPCRSARPSRRSVSW